MKKIRFLMAITLCALCASKLNAQQDVTTLYMEDPGFELCTTATANVATAANSKQHSHHKTPTR